MASGGPGDHPVSDITTWNRPQYGEQTDALIRKIADLCSRRELYEWWEKEIGWEATPGKAALKAALRYQELLERARLGGWEVPAGDGA
jgi:hypothetical protein